MYLQWNDVSIPVFKQQNSWEKTHLFEHQKSLENGHTLPAVQSEGPDIGSSPLDGARTPSQHNHNDIAKTTAVVTRLKFTAYEFNMANIV